MLKGNKSESVLALSDESHEQQTSSPAAEHHQRPEDKARATIDAQLRQVGWEADTQNLRYAIGARPTKGRNLAIAEWPTDSHISKKGFADYALFVGDKLVGIIEAKEQDKDVSSVIDYQCKDYARNIRKQDERFTVGVWGEYKVPFVFAANGRPYCEQYKIKSGILFLDLREPSNAPKALPGWMSPMGLMERLERDVPLANQALKQKSYELLFDKTGLNLRDYQIRAIQAAEKAVLDGKQTVLLAMATGTGKTRTVLGMIYRFLSTNRFRRILFLVDRTSLGHQTHDVFGEVKLEDLKTLTEIYNVGGLHDKFIDKEVRVQVSTVQSMVKRILYNTEESMPAVSDYDLVIIDEAHRGYILDKEMSENEIAYRDQNDYRSKYRSVIEYFDAVKIALTATPALHTTEIFGLPVFKYTYREAVLDGYLADHDAPHRLKTKLGIEGIHYEAGEEIQIYRHAKRDNEYQETALIADELDFDIEKFNRKIVVPEFNKSVLIEIARNLDPENPQEFGKTLIYAVDDKHADLIVDILKKYYSEKGVNNDAVLKITGSVGDSKRIEEAIRKFKNEKFPSIVVTVDLLTTGIDVPEITTLVFMRRVKSRILFEQMLGRATRLCPAINKQSFEIYDAVGVYESLQDVSTMKPVVVSPTISFVELLDGLEGAHDESEISDQVDQIIAKLQRKKCRMKDEQKEHFINMTDGKTPTQFIDSLKPLAPTSAKEVLIELRELFEFLDKRDEYGSRLVYYSDKEDRLLSHTRGYGESGQMPEEYLKAFSEYLKENINKNAALKMVCTRPRDLTRKHLKSLYLTLDRAGYQEKQLSRAVSQLSNEEIVADIISIIRRYAIGSPLVDHETRIHQAINKLKRAHHFSKQELTWIDRMERYLKKENLFHVSSLEDEPFKDAGGFARIDRIFEHRLASIIEELNRYLYEDTAQIA